MSAALNGMLRRPGRRIMTIQTTEDIERTFGDPIHLRNEEHIRIFYKNVKGLSYAANGEDYVYYIASTTDIGADLLCRHAGRNQNRMATPTFEASIPRQTPKTSPHFESHI
jgi:hypothetical protein